MQVIDPVAPRHVAVTKDGKVPVTVSNGPTKLELLTIPKHKKNPDVGSKTLYRTSSILIDQDDAQALSEGEEVRSAHVFVCQCCASDFPHIASRINHDYPSLLP